MNDANKEYGTEEVANELPAIMTVEEAAKWLRVRRTTCYEAVRRGDIPCIRLGRQIRISKSALIAWAEGKPKSS